MPPPLCLFLLAFCSLLTHRTMSSAMFKANFPTLVPPNFCTTQERLTLSSWGALETIEGASRGPLAVPLELILHGSKSTARRVGGIWRLQ
jgi:hypothetical protein